jgi:universal stress protein E
MEGFRKILFFADGARGEKQALRAAVELARHDGAELTVMDVVPHVSTDDSRLEHTIHRLQQSMIDERTRELEDMIAAIVPGNAPNVTSLVVAGDKDFIEVIKTVMSEGFDLVIKGVDTANTITATLFGNNDLRLMRQCPCPVWIIKATRRRKISTILAAVDLTSDERGTVNLSEQIMAIATRIARREGAELHAMTVWHQPIDPSVRKRMEIDAYQDFLQSYKDRIRQRFRRLMDKFAGDEITDHIVKGVPSRAITRFVSDYDVDLLVMGTISRSGIPGFLIGNTAERVLNEVDCSVLTLKPEGFKHGF